MSKARTLADFISDGSEFADGTISVAEVSGAAPLASPSFTGATSIASGSLSVTGTTGIALGDATPATFGSGVPTVVFQGTAANGRGGAINFREYAASGDGAITSQIYSTDGADGYGFVLNAEQGSIKLNAGGLTATKLEVTTSGVVINETGADNDFRVESDNNSNMLLVDAGNDRVQVNSVNPQSTTLLSVRGNGNNIEWGHNNTTSGYYGVLGANNNNGNPFIAFSANANSGTSNTYDTDGFIGTILRGTTGGELSIEQTLLANADNQVPVQRLGIAATEIVANEASTDTDFRVESDSNTHMFFVNAGGNAVGVNWGSPSEMFSVKDGNMLLYSTTSYDTVPAQLKFQYNVAAGSNPSSGYITTIHSSQNTYSGNLLLGGRGFYSGSYTDVPVLTVSAYKRVGINLDVSAGYADPSATLHVLTSGSEDPYVLVDGSSSTRDSGYKINAGGGVDIAIRADAAGNMFFAPNAEIKVDSASNVVINEDGANRDFRIESDSNDHMLFVDSGQDRVKVGTSTSVLTGPVPFQVGGMGIRTTGIGSTATDMGIPINQGPSGGTCLLVVNRNTNSGTGTDSGLYMVQFYYDGDNTPALIHIAGDNFITIGKTGTSPNETMTLTNAAGGNCSVMLIMNT